MRMEKVDFHIGLHTRGHAEAHQGDGLHPVGPILKSGWDLILPQVCIALVQREKSELLWLGIASDTLHWVRSRYFQVLKLHKN